MSHFKNEIWIITRRAGYNFGSSLQAYAMQQTLSMLGFYNRIIDYDEYKLRWKIRPFVHNVFYSFMCLFPLFWRTVCPSIYRHFAKRHIQRKKFDIFDRTQLRLTKKSYRSSREITKDVSQCRACVCGSDQIWCPLLFDPTMFLDFCIAPEIKRVAYAPSIGLPRLDSHQKKIHDLTINFHALSIREKQGAKLLQELLNRNDVAVMPDPTLLLEPEKWLSIATMPPAGLPYILCYFLGAELIPRKFIRELQEKTGCRILNIQMYYNKQNLEAEALDTVSPDEFIGLVKNATYVCTDSFHGTIFSILFQKKFFCFKRFEEAAKNNQNSRIFNLLDMLSLSHRLCDENSEVIDGDIDYSQSIAALEQKKQEAFAYLKHALA